MDLRNKVSLLLGLVALAASAAACGRSGLSVYQGARQDGGTANTGGAAGSSPAAGGSALSHGGVPGSGGIAGPFGRGGTTGTGGGMGGFPLPFPLPDGGLAGIPGLLGDASLSGLLPDGGLATVFEDGGLWGRIADASRDSVIGRLLCDGQVKTGVACSGSVAGCVLPSGGGACVCAGTVYICPANTNAGPQTCPAGAGTGMTCSSPLTTCIGGGGVMCICGMGTYVCY